MINSIMADNPAFFSNSEFVNLLQSVDRAIGRMGLVPANRH